MRHFLLFFLAILFTNTALAQSPDAQPEPIGGVEQLDTYVRFNARIPLNYPVGNVTVKGVVQPDGTVIDLQVEQGLDDILNHEALRVMRLYRGWKPAEKDGRLIDSPFTYTVNFQENKNPDFNQEKVGFEYFFDKKKQKNPAVNKRAYRVFVPTDEYGIPVEGKEVEISTKSAGGWGDHAPATDHL